MATLKDILLGDKRPRVIDDCVRLVDDEVDHKSGLAGLAIKGAYSVVKAVKPGIIREAVDRLLDPFVDALEPFHAQFLSSGQKRFADVVTPRASEVANALLGVTDARIGGTKHNTIKKAYEKLRPTAHKHVEAAVPGVGRVVDRHL